MNSIKNILTEIWILSNEMAPYLLLGFILAGILSQLISKKIIQKHGAVSVQCCLSMVNNLSKISKSKVCVSVTGIAGPGGATKQKPVGLVYIGIKNGKKIIINKNHFKNRGRTLIQKLSLIHISEPTRPY